MPEASIGLVSNLWSKMMHFKKAGDTEQGHAHVFDHLTLLAKGAMKVIVNGVASDFKAPHMIFIKKDAVHELIALEDDTVAYCIHALRNGEGVDDIIDPTMVPDGVRLTVENPLHPQPEVLQYKPLIHTTS
jgi:hypothetical protein